MQSLSPYTPDINHTSASGATVGHSSPPTPTPPAKPQLPYDGFADGPIVMGAELSASSSRLTLKLSNALGLAFKPTYSCGLGSYGHGASSGCCQYNRTFEISTASSGSNDSLWSAVPMHEIQLIPALASDGPSRPPSRPAAKRKLPTVRHSGSRVVIIGRIAKSSPPIITTLVRLTVSILRLASLCLAQATTARPAC